MRHAARRLRGRWWWRSCEVILSRGLGGGEWDEQGGNGEGRRDQGEVPDDRGIRPGSPLAGGEYERPGGRRQHGEQLRRPLDLPQVSRAERLPPGREEHHRQDPAGNPYGGGVSV